MGNNPWEQNHVTGDGKQIIVISVKFKLQKCNIHGMRSKWIVSEDLNSIRQHDSKHT